MRTTREIRHHTTAAQADSATESTDPVCGMAVRSDAVPSATHDGRRFRFCSATCRAKFVAEASRYLLKSDGCCGGETGNAAAQSTIGEDDSECCGSEAASVRTSEPSCCSGGGADLLPVFDSPPPRPVAGAAGSTCGCHPEIVIDESGDCPKCGMALEPILPGPASNTATVYACPMHPEVE